jgi:hypothetical protein
MEQTARALNSVCRSWLERRCGGSRAQRVSSVIQYHQARNLVAKRSRLGTPRKNE